MKKLEKFVATVKASRNPLATIIGLVSGYLIAGKIGPVEIQTWLASITYVDVYWYCVGSLSTLAGYLAFRDKD